MGQFCNAVARFFGRGDASHDSIRASVNSPNMTMTQQSFVTPHEVRARFAAAMSDMYRREVPQYGTLLELVAGINKCILSERPALAEQMASANELDRLSVERHGAIRVGTAEELGTLTRLLAVMGMEPVG